MRKLLPILAAVSLAAPAAAQPPVRVPPSAPRLTLTPAQQTALQQTVARGRQLAAVDRAGQISTRDMIARIPDPIAAGIVGWVAEREGNALAVTYYAAVGGGFAAVYRAQVLGGRVVSPTVYPADTRPRLTGIAARMAAARAAVDALDHRACGAQGFNIFALQPDTADGPIAVYEINPRLAADRVPGGGHYRTIVTGGAPGTATLLTGACGDLALPAVTAGQPSRPLVINARDAAMPNEAHVFLSLWTGRRVVVATGTDQVRLWGVTGEGIGELRQ